MKSAPKCMTPGSSLNSKQNGLGLDTFSLLPYHFLLLQPVDSSKVISVCITTTISNLKRHRAPADGYLEETALSGGGVGPALEFEQAPPLKKAALNPIFQAQCNEMPSLSLVQPNLLLSAISQANPINQAALMPMALGSLQPTLLPSNVLLPSLSYSFQNNLVNSPYANYPALLTQPSVSSSLTFEGNPLLAFPTPDIKVDPSSLYNVFVGDLGQDVDNNSLLSAFKKFGQIAEAKVIRDAQSMKSRGYGFVTFWKQEDAQKAIDEMNGQVVGKRAIRTNWATRKNNENKRSTTYEEVLNACDGENTSVYLGNIGPEVSENDVREVFSKFGTIRQIRMFSPKNYAFVVFDTKENAAKAIHEFGGQELRGHTITCSWGKLSDQTPKSNPLLVFANMNRLMQPQMNAISQLYSPFVPNWH
uniref:Nucleolysin TIA-1/TIAR n=1 Tax=Bursaphelenchus xylophilus TaxID=6326 RepID=A0A1I7STE8_BURXY